jgi:hypothetical protein
MSQRAEQVAKEIVAFTQNNPTQASIDFALMEINRYFVEKKELKA